MKPLCLVLIAAALLALATVVAGAARWPHDAAAETAAAAESAENVAPVDAPGRLPQTTPHLASIAAASAEPAGPAARASQALIQDLPILAVLLAGIGGLLWIRRHMFQL